MKHGILHTLPIGLVFIHLGSAARYSRSSSYRRTYYYNSGSSGSGDDEDTIILVGVLVGFLVLSGLFFAFAVCYVKLKKRAERKKEEAKELEQNKTTKNIDQKRSRNVVGTTDF
ncbi:uncharacterized protein LOC124144849 [Haliotis rufescens]|uniref:uncharacterized protein LOC124144849 n=1 Tax=Haliotis rufescens TaxID=6454 RepID=UPI001EAFE0B5|nr:uncharacterized protein LOC124144849 [Haliotis rufescens]